MKKEEIKEWVEDNIFIYEPDCDYDLEQAIGDMLYNFFIDELEMDVSPHDEDNYEWEHKEFLIDTFKNEWAELYS